MGISLQHSQVFVTGYCSNLYELPQRDGLDIRPPFQGFHFSQVPSNNLDQLSVEILCCSHARMHGRISPSGIGHANEMRLPPDQSYQIGQASECHYSVVQHDVENRRTSALDRLLRLADRTR